MLHDQITLNGYVSVYVLPKAHLYMYFCVQIIGSPWWGPHFGTWKSNHVSPRPGGGGKYAESQKLDEI